MGYSKLEELEKYSLKPKGRIPNVLHLGINKNGGKENDRICGIKDNKNDAIDGDEAVVGGFSVSASLEASSTPPMDVEVIEMMESDDDDLAFGKDNEVHYIGDEKGLILRMPRWLKNEVHFIDRDENGSIFVRLPKRFNEVHYFGDEKGLILRATDFVYKFSSELVEDEMHCDDLVEDGDEAVVGGFSVSASLEASSTPPMDVKVIEMKESDDDDDLAFGKDNEVHYIGDEKGLILRMPRWLKNEVHFIDCDENGSIFVRLPKRSNEVHYFGDEKGLILRVADFVYKFSSELVEDEMHCDDFVEIEEEKGGGKGVDCSAAETESSGVKKVGPNVKFEEVGLSRARKSSDVLESRKVADKKRKRAMKSSGVLESWKFADRKRKRAMKSSDVLESRARKSSDVLESREFAARKRKSAMKSSDVLQSWMFADRKRKRAMKSSGVLESWKFADRKRKRAMKSSDVLESRARKSSDVFESRKFSARKRKRAMKSSDVLQSWMFADRKRKRAMKSSDVREILVSSILKKGEVMQSAAENVLPLKFTFGVEEPEPVAEKSDYEKELDNLWSEFDFSLKSSEMGSFSPPVIDSEKTDASRSGDNPNGLCSQGNHQLVLDEEIGIRCLSCSFVMLEMKHVLPSFANTIYSSGISDKKFPTSEIDHSILDGLQFQSSKDEPRDFCSHTKGMVWDIIPGIMKSMYQHQQEGFEFMWKNLAGTLVLDELKSCDSNGGVGGCIISHAPGTGKTRLTIVFLQTYLEIFPNSRPVIIAPASMLLTWEEEFRKWNVGIPFHNLNNVELSAKENIADVNINDANGYNSRNKDLIRMIKLYLWSKGKSILGVSYSLYEKLAGQKNELEKETKKKRKIMLERDKESEEMRKILLELPGLLVLDEGHTPRNQNSRIWKALAKVETKRRIILSGTPFQNNFCELYNILCLVRPEFANMIPTSLKKFCRTKQIKKNVVVGAKSAAPLSNSTDKFANDAIEELKGIMAPFVHVHKGSILQESLPGLKDCVVVLNPTRLQKSIAENIQKYKNRLEFEHKVSLSTVHPSLILQVSLSKKEKSLINRGSLEKLRLDPNEGIKTRFVMELVRLSVAMNEKVLVFSQFIDPLLLIKDQLSSIFNWTAGKEVLQMHGKFAQQHRQSVINVFNDPKSEARILLASTRACSEGINLVGASRVVLLDVVWNPSIERQAISRAYRLGQKKVVYTYHLIMLGTSEWDKYCKQAEKDRLSELVFASSDKEEKGKQKTSKVLSEDKILDEMISHERLKYMFERIIYQPKESKLIETCT